MGKQISYIININCGHSTMHLVHPNQCHAGVTELVKFLPDSKCSGALAYLSNFV